MELIRLILLKIGVIAMLAGCFPPAAHLFDALTCETVEATVAAVRRSGRASVAFSAAGGQRIEVEAAPYHIGNRPVADGDRVQVIYRSWDPQSLAPHRNVSDTLIGLGAMLFGAILLFVRRHLSRDMQPAAASKSGPSAIAVRQNPTASSGPNLRTPNTTRVSAVQRDRGWLPRS